MESSLFMFVAKVVRTNPLLRAVCVSVQNMELDPYVHVVYVLQCFLNLPVLDALPLLGSIRKPFLDSCGPYLPGRSDRSELFRS